MTATDSIRDETTLTRWLRKHIVAICGLLMVAGFATVMWRQLTLCEELIEEGAVHDAARFNEAVAEFRTVYTSEVVGRAKEAGLEIRHDYSKHAGSIPLPATLSMMLGNRLGENKDGIKTRLYSDFPFPWRKDGGPQDSFEQDALTALRTQPNEPFFRFESHGGEPVIRYATADLMRESCVHCHNTHADTPRSGWKAGDVRGVLSVTVPLKQAVTRTHAAVRSQFYVLAGCGGVVLCIFSFTVVRIRRHSDSVEATCKTLSQKQTELEHEREVAEQAQAELEEKAEQLENSRHAALNLMADMEAARDAADAASLAKSNFLANMSHEIRTPMTAIIGFAELLTDPDATDEDRERAVETVNRNGKHLLHLINSILDLSKIEAGHLNVEQTQCSPTQIVQDVVELLSVRSDEKGLDLRVSFDGPVPQHISSDSFRLNQALVNLVGNAIKFTSEGSVEIRIRCDREAGLLTMDVIDSGIGMTAEQLERVFEPFSQADTSMTRRFGGTGLGLAITRRIARLLGGDLTVTSQINQGSTFSLTVSTGSLDGVAVVTAPAPVSAESTSTIPAVDNSDTQDTPVARIPAERPVNAQNGQRQARSTAKKSTQNSTPSMPDGRVLIVEDGPDNQRIVSYLLRKAGLDVDIADNGLEGVEAAKASLSEGRPYDLILMDMQMPVMDGYTATGTLRESGWTRPIVALTAHALKEEVDRCLSAGCDAFLRKPIEKPAFFAEIRRQLERSAKEHSVAALPAHHD